MRNIVLTVIAAACAAAAVMAQGDPQPTCRMCPGTYIPKSEIEAYTQKAVAEKLTDQQVRDIEIGRRTSASASCTAASSRRRRRNRSPNTIR